ncbi:MAG: ABC transporter substrate-binding protein [Pseudomonadota bacterium]
MLTVLIGLVAGLPQAYGDDMCAPASDSSRVAIAGGSITEIVYELGLEERLVAVDRTSNFPSAALELPSVGYVRNVSAEGVLSLSPTLVLGEDDMGPPATIEQLRATGIETRKLAEAHDIEGILDKVRCIARIFGLDEQAQQAAVDKYSPLLNQLAEVDQGTDIKAALVLSLADGVPMAGGADTSAQGVLSMAGATNVFDEFTGWKPVSLEAMAASNPEFIVMPTRGLKAAGGREAVLQHPAVRLTPAGQKGQLIDIDGMTLLGFGPRTLDAAHRLAILFGTLSELR